MKKVRRLTSSKDLLGVELEDHNNPFLPHPTWRRFLQVIFRPVVAVLAVLLHVLPVAMLVCAIVGGTLFGLHHWHLS